mmetsp:Transcript_106223/g.226792  ORF Transcript_106223/g.226792 Transcript_106223/m.226792 type:complete len:101 (-) Transcript_106223:489-791(-)
MVTAMAQNCSCRQYHGEGLLGQAGGPRQWAVTLREPGEAQGKAVAAVAARTEGGRRWEAARARFGSGLPPAVVRLEVEGCPCGIAWMNPCGDRAPASPAF